MQIELINETLAEMQGKKALPSRKQVGFSAPQYTKDDESSQ